MFRQGRRLLAAAAIAGCTAIVVPASANAFCIFSCTYTQTRYPIVLAHGMSGYDELFGVVEYWYGIPEGLRRSGADVHLTTVSQFNATEVRGEQLLAQVEDIVAATGKAKVHLIGHSHGGLDVRYVAAVRPELVASVTTIGTPHKGADLADFLRNTLEDGSVAESVLATLAESAGAVLALLTGRRNPQDAVGGLNALTTAGTDRFNSAFPAGVPAGSCGVGAAQANGVRYFSWSGTGVLTALLDPSDVALAVSSVFYDESNDGLVGRCSSRLGTVIRDNYLYNHLDQVNQVLGLTAPLATDPVAVFRTHANRLKRLGL